jgi:hypothetical protein
MDWKALIPPCEDVFGAEASQADRTRSPHSSPHHAVKYQEMQSLEKLVSSLDSRPGTKHDAQILVAPLKLQTGSFMTDPSATAEQPRDVLPPVDRGMSIGRATVITVISLILVAGSTYEVVKGTLSAGTTRLLAVVSLLSLVALSYGLIELSLGVIATTAERRRKAREVTERRKGDRARRPAPH